MDWASFTGEGPPWAGGPNSAVLPDSLYIPDELAESSLGSHTHLSPSSMYAYFYRHDLSPGHSCLLEPPQSSSSHSVAMTATLMPDAPLTVPTSSFDLADPFPAFCPENPLSQELDEFIVSLQDISASSLSSGACSTNGSGPTPIFPAADTPSFSSFPWSPSASETMDGAVLFPSLSASASPLSTNAAVLFPTLSASASPQLSKPVTDSPSSSSTTHAPFPTPPAFQPEQQREQSQYLHATHIQPSPPPPPSSQRAKPKPKPRQQEFLFVDAADKRKAAQYRSTIAARKQRSKKQSRMQELESALQQVAAERDAWRDRADFCGRERDQWRIMCRNRDNNNLEGMNEE